VLQIIVNEEKRLDVFVAAVQGLSRSFVNVLLDQGKISVNGKVVYKPSAKVKPGDVIELDYQPSELQDIPEIDIEILYQDDDCVVINKPAGVLTHSKGVFNPEATVSTFIRQFTEGMNDNRGGIVHRLDRITSGVLICAKNEQALAKLQKQFSDRKSKKIYNAVIAGTLDPDEATIDMPIERNPKKPQTFRVGPNGKPAQTHYKVLQTGERYSLVELRPVTGRTHQLRVHLAQQDHPIVGDTLYGGEPADRTYLHALSLEITLPSGERKTFTAPLPPEFNAKINDSGL
jgi:23S rRNA pseudouridine1911/1915/1917 synthase